MRISKSMWKSKQVYIYFLAEELELKTKDIGGESKEEDVRT